MKLLTYEQARQLAEEEWGRGGTDSHPTNRPGAYYFSCSAHGGFVIDTRTLTDTEFLCISKYVQPHFRPPFPRVFLLEEDCNWCLAPYFAGINLIDKPFRDELIKSTFDRL